MTSAPSEYQVDSEHPVGREWRSEFDWMVSIDDQKVVYEGWQLAIERCMKGSGFVYVPVEFVEVDVGPLINPLNRAVAIDYGYHTVGLVPSVENLNTDESEAFRDALAGPGGCGVTARRDWVEPFDSYFQAAEAAIADVERAIGAYLSSPGAAAAISEWSGCMQQEGYAFGTPDEASAEFSEDPSISEEERRVRLADLDCDLAVGLTAKRSQWERARIETWILENEGRVTDLLRRREDFDSAVADLREEMATR